MGSVGADSRCTDSVVGADGVVARRRRAGRRPPTPTAVSVVVVGGAGFIGSHLIERLLAEGHAVDVVDHLSPGSLANLAEARAAGGV